MTGLMGDNYMVQVADLSESPLVYADVACQGDLEFNTGKALQISRTKNCKHAYFTEAGYTAAFPMELERPLPATQELILDASDNETLLGVRITSTETGAPQWTGQAYVVLERLSAPTEGPVPAQVGVAWVDDPTRSAVSA